ncbi:MAG TPA: hypothetical protein VGQ51_04220, partial [Puia sp.]|nr:hypothetical protein [Puia sp.]
DFDLKRYFLSIIKIICYYEYEPRLMAFGIVERLAPEISNATRAKALKFLEAHRIRLERDAIEKGENSSLHFVEKTQELLSQHHL